MTSLPPRSPRPRPFVAPPPSGDPRGNPTVDPLRPTRPGQPDQRPDQRRATDGRSPQRSSAGQSGILSGFWRWLQGQDRPRPANPDQPNPGQPNSTQGLAGQGQAAGRGQAPPSPPPAGRSAQAPQRYPQRQGQVPPKPVPIRPDAPTNVAGLRPSGSAQAFGTQGQGTQGRPAPTPIDPRRREASPNGTGPRSAQAAPQPMPQPVPISRYRGQPEPTRPAAGSPLPVAAGATSASPQSTKPRSAPKDQTRGQNGSAQAGLGALILQIGRVLVLSVGLGAIVGTGLLALDPSLREPATVSGVKLNGGRSGQAAPGQKSTDQVGLGLGSESGTLQPITLPLRRELPQLQGQVQQIAMKWPKLTAHIAIVDLDTGDYAVWNDRQAVPAASTIKVPILYAFFQDVDAGKARLDELLTMEPGMVAGESGELQYRPAGSKFSALETVTKMIGISDNTATNMVMARLGGAAVLNQRFLAWGLKNTLIKKPLPDLGALNLTSARDLAMMMAAIHQGDGLSTRSRDRLLGIMRNTAAQSLLPKGIGKGADIAHKTGTLGGLLADAGLIDTPNGRRYAAVALVNRPRDDKDAAELIRWLSKTAYDYFAAQPPLAR